MKINVKSVLSVNQYGLVLSKRISGWYCDETDIVSEKAVVDIDTSSIEEAIAVCRDYGCPEFISDEGRIIRGTKIVESWEFSSVDEAVKIGFSDEVEAKIRKMFA
jgi:hypothetical protein